jgi:hypothetical protein
MKNSSMRLSALSVAALLLATACSEDNLVEPIFGSACVQGTLSPGETVQGSLSSASCRQTNHIYSDDPAPYESWSVHLEAGKAYMFYQQQVPDPTQEGRNDVDALLTLYGKDDQGRSLPLVVSDDDGGGVDGHDSEFFFIAPRTGDYVLVAAAYDWEQFGGYRLSMKRCPVLGVLDTIGTYTFPSATGSSCIRHMAPHGGLSVYSFLSIDADSFETITVGLEHDASDAVIEMFGPGFDTFANLYDEVSYEYSWGNGFNTYLSMDEIPGTITVALGTTFLDMGGTYTVTLDRTPSVAPRPPADQLDGQLTRRPLVAKQKK